MFKKSISGELKKFIPLSELEIIRNMETPSKEFGDYAFPCFILAKKLKKDPKSIAEELEKKINSDKEKQKFKAIDRVETKSGYVNIFLKKEFLLTIVNKILKEKQKFGKSQEGGNKKILLEYSSPNTNKPLHLGHLRNDSLGMSLTRILENSSCKVIKTNIINDRGIHICKSMLAYKKFGKNNTPEKAKQKSDHFVGKFYILAEKKLREQPELEQDLREMLRKWEAEDKETRALWKKMNLWALNGIKQTYSTFGSEFDLLEYESQVYMKAKPLIEEGKKKGIFQKDENGNLIAKLEPEIPNKVVLRADGTSVYITQDIALTKHRLDKYNPDRIIWIVASEQNLHFKQLFKILGMLGYKGNFYHFAYGLVNLESGRMKTREGTVIDADNLIQEVKELAKQEIIKREKQELGKKELENRALKIALAAIKFYLIKVEAHKDMLFIPEKSIAFDGETGPYLQYTYARASSILRKSTEKKFKTKTKINHTKNKILDLTQEEKQLLKTLAKFPETVELAAKNLAPDSVAKYTYELSKTFNDFYEKCHVLAAEEQVRKQRLEIVRATKQVLANSMYLLNIPTLEKM